MNREPNASGDDSAEPNPVDAELIAYLDGELDAADARRVEDSLDGDPKLRARADALKRSYDLLDFLPKPEPTPTFSTRTMDRLPVAASVSGKSVSTAATTTAPVPAASTSGLGMRLSQSQNSPELKKVPTWAWAFGIFLAIGVALGVGYLGTAAARSYIHAAGSRQSGADSVPLADLHAIENLPLYALVDDMEFLTQLESHEFFGDELQSLEGAAALPPVEAEKLTAKQLEECVKAFAELPVERREKIRAFDRQIHTLEPARRARAQRLLETYAAWVQRLTEHDRTAILSAPSVAKRLDDIRDILNTKWIASLPAAYHQKLKNLTAEEKADLKMKWRADEEKHRADWHLARVQWEAARTGKQPWPFDNERMRKDVLAFAQAAYHPDEPKKCRLSSSGPEGGDLARWREAKEHADQGEWFLLGKVVYDFSNSKKYEMLPEPGKGNPIVDFTELTPALTKILERKGKSRIDQHIGKWPDFALAVNNEMTSVKALANLSTHHLGPCKPEEFRNDVKQFFPAFRNKLTESEWNGLKLLDGHWPAYPRELIRLAKLHDLSVPGALLPGPPSQWDRQYNPRPPMRPGG